MDIDELSKAKFVYVDQYDYMESVDEFVTALAAAGYITKNTSEKVKGAILRRMLEMYQSERQDLENELCEDVD